MACFSELPPCSALSSLILQLIFQLIFQPIVSRIAWSGQLPSYLHKADR